MTNEQLTRCPHCKATFKVTNDQLEAAGGKVRCGACMNVFDALAYILSEREEIPQSDSVEKTPPKIKTPAQSPPPENLDASSHFNEELIQDDPEFDELDHSTNSLSAELSDSIMAINKEPTSSHYPSDADNFEAPADESWTEKILEELNEEENLSTEGKREPSLGSGLTAENLSADAQSPADIIEAATNEAEAINFLYEDDRGESQKSFARKALVFTLCGGLLLLLIAQASWFHYEKLARYPLLAKGFTFVCEHLNCALPELADITKIRSHNLVVRSHPTTRNALIVDAVITNHAEFDQAFPDLALYFSDLNNQVIAQRIISPEKYLSPEILAWQKMPKQEPIHISLELVDPGKEAVNYKLRFFPQKTGSRN